MLTPPLSIAFKEAFKQVCTSAKVEVIPPFAQEDDDNDGHSSSPKLVAAVAKISPLSCQPLPSTIPVNQIAARVGAKGDEVEKEKEEERISSLIEYMSALIFNESAKTNINIDNDIDIFGANCTSGSNGSISSSSSSSYKVYWSELPPQLSLTQSR